jgi:hypothetical protein
MDVTFAWIVLLFVYIISSSIRILSIRSHWIGHIVVFGSVSDCTVQVIGQQVWVLGSSECSWVDWLFVFLATNGAYEA